MRIETGPSQRFRWDGPRVRREWRGGGSDEPRAMRLAHLTDIHAGRPYFEKHLVCRAFFQEHRPDALRILSAWLHQLARLSVDAVVVTGDLVQRGDDREGLEQVRAAFLAAAFPVHVVPGNHDVDETRQPFDELFGRFPRIVTTACGAELVLLDSTAGLGSRDGWETVERAAGVDRTRGRVGAEQLAAAERSLTSAGLRVLALHHHVVRRAPECPGDDKWMDPIIDSPRVLGWGRDHGVRLVLHGHKHTPMEPGVNEYGMIVLNGGSSTECVPGSGRYAARIVDVFSNSIGVSDVYLTA